MKRWRRKLKLPKENPYDFLENGRHHTTTSLVACVGDSLTHGVVSADYVSLLRQKLSTEGYEFINAGINGDLGYNVLQRLDVVLECRPDTVILLIGTNDINATFSQKIAASYHKNKQIPVIPDLEWSGSNLEKIFEQLTAAKIKNLAVLSIPMLGENIDSEMNSRVEKYNEKLRDLAIKYQIEYLPLHERLMDELPKVVKPPIYQGQMGLIVKAVFRRWVLRQTWQSISKRYGFHFLTDHIHLNEKGAKIISDLIEQYLRCDLRV
jgi:lysophospholipase L1-like esterase